MTIPDLPILQVFSDQEPETPIKTCTDKNEAASVLADAGVRFEQWQAACAIQPGDEPEKVLAAYAEPIERLKHAEGYQTVDVVSMHPDHPDKDLLRQKFLDEHTHGEDEVRFFVQGHGLFSLHLGDRVYEVFCQQGDLISVPAKTPHWFDMGSRPAFVAIRLFNNPEGWVAHYTGSRIAENFTRLD